MRISLRRMRCVLFIFKSLIPKKITKKFYANLSMFASHFDKARDIDVYIETYLHKEKLTSSELLLYEIVTNDRIKEYKRIKKILASKKFRKFRKKFQQWVKKKKWRKKLHKKELLFVKKNIIPFAKNFLNTYQNEIIAHASDLEYPLADKEAHTLRIKLKNLRYATDLFSPYFGNKLHNLRKVLKKLQDILGELHDIYVTKELHKIFLHTNKNKKLFAVIQKIELENTSQKEKLQEAFYKQWKLFIKSARAID